MPLKIVRNDMAYVKDKGVVLNEPAVLAVDVQEASDTECLKTVAA